MEKQVHFRAERFQKYWLYQKNTLIKSHSKLNFLQEAYWMGTYVNPSCSGAKAIQGFAILKIYAQV